jgi:hypothetical protein
MTTVEPGIGSSGLVSRVKNIILTPAREWDRIDGEPATVKGLYLGYFCILAAIGPVCTVIGHLLFGSMFGGAYLALGIVPSIVTAVVSYVLSLVSVAIMAFIIDALAPSFDGTKNQIQAFKVAGYSMTPMWVAGVLGLVPMLGLLAIIAGLYGLYVLYLGLPKLMRAPQEKAVGYTLVVIVVGIVVQWVVFVCVGLIVGLAGLSAIAGAGGLMAAHSYG